MGIELSNHIWETRRTGDGEEVHVLSSSFWEAATPLIYKDGVDPYSEEGVQAFKDFCVEHDIHYYGAPKENFFMAKGIEEALMRGTKYLLLENLS